MIVVDESDPVGEVALSFPYRDVQIRKNIDPKDLYDLQEEIGRGKFGTVYKCKEKTSGLQLAAKFVGVPKKEDRRNVEREVEIMRELQHARLIQLYDAFENGKVMCVVLELIEGGELFERVIDDDFVLTEKSCTAFMRQICEGIAFIHKQRILHLDMKPENILCLTKTGNRIKIIDFGLARRFDPDKKLQVLFGTPEFVAPEVVNFDQIGYGTDMWSVGVICYVLLSGLSPFMGHTDCETMANVTIAKYDFDDEAFEDISEGAKDFIKKLLLKDISARMTAEECLKHAWLKRKPPPSPPPVAIASTPNSMEVTKDNLKQFVERWNEHPNSPYVFEMTCDLRRNSSLRSLSGLSPSPCGSIASSDSDMQSSLMGEHLHLNLPLPPMDHLRRASDSTGIVKNDVSEKVNLAEEIRKLSDKLFQLSTLPTLPIEPVKVEKPLDVPQMKLINNITSKIDQDTSKIYHSTSKTQPISIRKASLDAPWRTRTKFRVTELNRDVPRNANTSPVKLNSSPSFKESFNSKLTQFERQTVDQSTSNSPDGTKNLLLKLLEHWDDSQLPPAGGRPKSHSITDWGEGDSLGQRTISSLNTFFQSRASNKITTFHKTETIQHSP
ncbi:myosin light chain kinase, smooth muscle-like [Atheta coriaria]|uniref:myosin light chain kinase, smooth muscle-like n=1 Tax=Dalotia coriaria TaxID=877792 RepID=UPI0031F4685F